MARKKVTIHTLQKKKSSKEPIVVVTAYDYPTAKIVDKAGVDVILVGDSLGMVVLGYDSTVPVTMDEMLHHCKAVSRGNVHCLTVGDMPFGSYHVSAKEAVHNAVKLMKDGGVDAVKLEGGCEMAHTVEAITKSGIPVMGHIGLTPQSVSMLGGYTVQGKTAHDAAKLYSDAKALEKAGCFAIVLESVPSFLASFITEKLTIPTIGIGAGVSCDGQVLVFHDMLGLFDGHVPKFVKRYAEIGEEMRNAITQYSKDVRAGEFPAFEHTYQMDEAEWKSFLQDMV